MNKEHVSVLWCVPGSEALQEAFAREPTIRLRTCLDAVDLAAAALIEPQSIAVVSAESPRVNADLVMRVESLGTRFIALGVHAPGTPERETERAVTRSWGITQIAEVQDVAALVSELVHSAPVSTPQCAPSRESPQESPVPTSVVTVVWGTGGAPGRSVVARGLAEAWASSGVRTVLIDADPAASQAIALGITNGDGGLMRAIRLAQRRSLTPTALAHVCRSLNPGLSVLTGIERDDEVFEVTPEVVNEVVRVAQAVFARVVIDLGGHGTQAPVLASLLANENTEVIAVVRNTVVGLARAVRELPAVIEVIQGAPLRLIVNGTTSDKAARDVLEKLVITRGGTVAHWFTVARDDRIAHAEEQGRLMSEIRGRSRARKDFGRMVKELARFPLAG